MIRLIRVTRSNSLKGGYALAWFGSDGRGLEIFGVFRPLEGGLMITLMRPSLTLTSANPVRGRTE